VSESSEGGTGAGLPPGVSRADVARLVAHTDQVWSALRDRRNALLVLVAHAPPSDEMDYGQALYALCLQAVAGRLLEELVTGESHE
jgi:hypothetical protein